MSNIDIAILGVVLVAFLGFAGTLFCWSSGPPAQTQTSHRFRHAIRQGSRSRTYCHEQKCTQ
jgi:hypothetical protein